MREPLPQLAAGLLIRKLGQLPQVRDFRSFSPIDERLPGVVLGQGRMPFPPVRSVQEHGLRGFSELPVIKGQKRSPVGIALGQRGLEIEIEPRPDHDGKPPIGQRVLGAELEVGQNVRVR